jgi:tripartite-type tricarboxylate transporter receptor subunit TctC
MNTPLRFVLAAAVSFRTGRTLLGCIAAIASLVLFMAPTVHAQAYPSRPITIVVATGAGSGQDLLARKVAEKLGERTGQQVLVENRPGGNAFVAMSHVAQARPDGYTLLAYTSIYIAGPLVQKSFTVDQIEDFSHIIRLSLTPGYYIANTQVPFKTMLEMFAWAKANPGKLAVGFPAINTQMDGLLMFDALGIKVNPILYQGTGAAMLTNLISNEIQVAQTAYSPVRGHIVEGRLRALAVLQPKRSPLTPDIPAMGDIAPQVVMTANSIGVSGPKGMPREIVAKLNAEFNAILKDPAILEWISKQFWSEPGGGTPDEWRQAQLQDRERYTQAAQKMGLKPE